MERQKMSMAALKNRALEFDRVEMRDLYARKHDADYHCKKHMGVWNLDKGHLACIAPKNYVAIPHREAVEAVVDAITSLNITAECEVKLYKDSVVVDINFPGTERELKVVGDKFTSGIRIISDYAEVAGLVIGGRVQRLACSNGMIVSEFVRSKRIKFTDELTLTVEGVIDTILKDIINNDDRLANMVSVCMKDSIEWQTLKLLLKHMFKRQKHTREILERMRKPSEQPTRWDLYNAVTNYATHGERLQPNVEAWLQNKAQHIIKTDFDELCEAQIRIKEPQLRTSPMSEGK